ncbi:MAG: NAD(P)H-dependent oxidoreductase [Candidatus Dadabacteria bacterium]|nr:MAG: NAD(P)H-dependent oxidoreductase [Candidatus Dadabacteria bacterium]
MLQPNILVLAGSTRTGSFNRKLAGLALLAAKSAGAAANELDLSMFDLPVYNGDLEEQKGLPESVVEIKKSFFNCNGFIFCSPEYNGSVSALLKNTVDWASRPVKDDPELSVPFKNKTALLLAASPGALGGLRGLSHLRTILTNLGVIVMPGQMALPQAHQAFDGNGKLLDQEKQAKLEGLVSEFVTMTGRLSTV